MWSLKSPRAKRISGPKHLVRQLKETFSTLSARCGHVRPAPTWGRGPAYDCQKLAPLTEACAKSKMSPFRPIGSAMLPETRYAKSGDVHIAYQVIGEGPFDLVFVPGFISHVEHVWDEPRWSTFLERLASFSRLICFDKRGTGLSDRVSAIPTLEERMDDVRAVMDAVGSERAALFGISEGGPMSLLFAATHPDRTLALTLYGSYALFPTAVMSPERLADYLEKVEELWGTGKLVPGFAPSLAEDVAFLKWWARFERLGASPSAVKTLMQMNSEIDIRGILPVIHVPTLIMHRVGDARVNVAAGRYLAQHIAGARYVELSGNDHLFCAGDSRRILDEIEKFLT